MPRKLKVLVACEYSATVREAFRQQGHDAVSCDLLPSDIPGPHLQCDVRTVLDRGWDMMIAFPDCTYLCASGMHWTTRGLRDAKLTDDAVEFVRTLMNAPIEKIAIENPIGALSRRIRKPDQIVQPWMFGDDASKRTCLWLKNLKRLQYDRAQIVPPKGWQLVADLSDMIQCPTCCDEAYCEKHEEHFGDCDCIGIMEDEVTKKSLDGVLFGTRDKHPRKPVWSNQTPSGQNKLGPSAKRGLERAKTYAGIAAAMAKQWR